MIHYVNTANLTGKTTSLCKLDVHTRDTRKPKANQAAFKLAKVCKFDVNRRRSSARVRRERQEEEEDVVMVVQFRSAKAGGLTKAQFEVWCIRMPGHTAHEY